MFYLFSSLGFFSQCQEELGGDVKALCKSPLLCGLAGTASTRVLHSALLYITHKYDVGGLCNGILGGLVAITAGCGNMESGSAVPTGFVSAFVYQAASMLLKSCTSTILWMPALCTASAAFGVCWLLLCSTGARDSITIMAGADLAAWRMMTVLVRQAPLVVLPSQHKLS